MQGGCLCGYTRYTATGEPAMVAVCHCTHCQKQTGTSFALLVAVPRASVQINGSVATFHDTGDSGHGVERSYCVTCGSPVGTNAAVKPELTFLYAGTLDNTSWVRPTIQIFCDNAQPWLKLEGLQRFARMPA